MQFKAGYRRFSGVEGELGIDGFYEAGLSTADLADQVYEFSLFNGKRNMRQDKMILLKDGAITEMNNGIERHVDTVLVGFKNTLFRKGKKTGYEGLKFRFEQAPENSWPVSEYKLNNEQWVVH